MDSLTQIVLGATVGAAVGGKTYGRKAALIGAIAGTIPDLDVIFLINADPVESMTTHRGWSHSLLFAVLFTPVMTWFISKIKFFGTSFKDKRLHCLIFLGLFTHILLDAMTIYGTQIFWPLKTPPIGIGSIFIIDLLYTVPLMVGLIWFLINRSTKPVYIGLIISTLYLLWSFTAQQTIQKNVQKNYQGVIEHILVQPTPFNTFLWRVLVLEENTYSVGYTSLFDDKNVVTYKTYPLNRVLLEDTENPAYERLQWFTKGFYALDEVDNQILFSDLRMGLEPDQYVFQFILAERQNGNIVTVPNRRYSSTRDLSRLSKIWERIWDDKVEL